DGLVHMGARFYDPTSGRFISPDPVGIDPSSPQSVNRYVYVNNNPYKYVDPDGRYLETAWDLMNIGWGVAAFAKNVAVGNYAGAALDAVGLVVDTAALVTPVPAGAGASIRAMRATEAATDVGTATGKTFQTYTKTHPKTGEVYSGRTSGTGTAFENIARRDSSHHMNQKGFGPAVLDKSSSNSAAVRGREQQLIDAFGGALSTGGSSGNPINGISSSNRKRDFYFQQAKREFGG
ncbi:RHS repeat-associated core domain-containing protein, partial [Allohahella marinimesophila]|uniref:RHS repeat-associated core domain-containing protein n=1 Tax=Allohahella marinimesophila TaxID=1054972 RepID=UPI0031CF2736